jgi:hypothetical protein
MTKTKYEVHKASGLVAVYVTEKRNAEDMIQQIRYIHESFNEFGEPHTLKIIQVLNGERNVIYTQSMRKFWQENLVLS